MPIKNQNTSSTINDLEPGSSGEDNQPRATEGILLERRLRRRMDLLSLNGALREHAKIYRALCANELSAFAAESRSKVLGRHCKMLSDRDTLQQAERLANLLGEPQDSPPLLQHFPDDDAASETGDDSEPTLQ